jgi:puromycin-sensitive aminopeptidase
MTALDDRDFRLSVHVRPGRYQAHLSIDLEHRTFTGEAKVSVQVARPQPELVLHAVALDLSSATLRAGGKSWPATVEVRAQSETVALRFDEPVPTGEVELELAWKGAFCDGLRGLYLGGGVALTQFEAADARRVFPCFDEPAFKARWALSVDVPRDQVALSNGRIDSEELRGDRKHVRFEQTELLSSYLVALVVGKLAASDEGHAAGVPVRTWSVPEKRALTAFGQDVALHVLPMLQDYFGLPYAFGKVDQVGAPDFEAGAMENAGLITYREVALLLDPATASLPTQKQVAEVVTHELAHQWFGNWVTMVWWDDLWLNEAFATWMAFKVVDHWRPQWRIWLDFDTGKAAALGLDALESTHPIHAEVRNAAQATENFDVITYEKGGSVLRMIEAFLGADTFRAGIRAYMKRHARANAVADDLWRALSEASRAPVLELANAWIGKPGFPVVEVSREGRAVTLRQRRFWAKPGMKSDEVWPVPMVLRYRDEGGVRDHRVLLEEREARVELPGEGGIQWVLGNGGATGFYRVAYDDGALAELAADLPSLEPSERIALLADTWARVRAAEARLPAFLSLAQRFEGERDWAVLNELVGRLGAIDYRLVADEDLPRFRAFVRALFAPALQEVGYDAAPGESDDVRLRRAALVRAVAGVGRDEAACAALRERLDRVLGGDRAALEPNLHDLAVTASARTGDAALFDRLRQANRSENDPVWKRRYLIGLASFESASLAESAQDLALGGEVALQELAWFLGALLANPAAQEPSWQRLRAGWEKVETRVANAPMIYRRVVEGLGNLRERRHLDEVQGHLASHPHPATEKATAQTLERLGLDVDLRERARPEVKAWLAARG